MRELAADGERRLSATVHIRQRARRPRKSPAERRAFCTAGGTTLSCLAAVHSAERMFDACCPFGPVLTSKATRCPSFSVLNPCS